MIKPIYNIIIKQTSAEIVNQEYHALEDVIKHFIPQTAEADIIDLTKNIKDFITNYTVIDPKYPQDQYEMSLEDEADKITQHFKNIKKSAIKEYLKDKDLLINDNRNNFGILFHNNFYQYQNMLLSLLGEQHTDNQIANIIKDNQKPVILKNANKLINNELVDNIVVIPVKLDKRSKTLSLADNKLSLLKPQHETEELTHILFNEYNNLIDNADLYHEVKNNLFSSQYNGLDIQYLIVVCH